MRIAVAALVSALVAAREIQLLPAGAFVARDGRPGPGKSWRIDAALAAHVIGAASARATPFVIDYEHQTLHAEANGEPAPAAGWFKTLEWREGQGLYATDVEWTARARAMIEAGEYRYLSPVFGYAPGGEVREILMAAITNNPALDGMEALALRAAARFSPAEESHMNELLKKLLAAIGLPETADEAAALGAVAALKADAGKLAGVESQLAALKAQTPDPARYAPVEAMRELQGQVAELTTRLHDREVGDLVEAALADGRLLSAQEEWARKLGGQDLAALKGYLDTAQPVAALKGTQTGGRDPGQGRPAGAAHLTEPELAVCKAMGLTAEQYVAAKA